MSTQFQGEKICEKCGEKSYIYKIRYPASDGYNHECGCPYCDYTFLKINKRSLDDYVAYKEKR